MPTAVRRFLRFVLNNVRPRRRMAETIPVMVVSAPVLQQRGAVPRTCAGGDDVYAGTRWTPLAPAVTR
jgi:hypothetical protein